MTKKFSAKAFTIVELLMVITIIGVVSGILVYASKDSDKAARDTDRKGDILDIRRALEGYALNNYGYYPVQDDDWCCIDATSGELQCDNITTLISNLPTDALYPQEYETGKPYAYYYKTENEGETYEIYAALETGGFYYYSSGDTYARVEGAIPEGGEGGGEEPPEEPDEWEVCGESVTFTYNGESVTYGTVLNEETGKCWLDRNLGASQVATAYNDEDAYGDLFQWGRLDDGHQSRISSTTTTLSDEDDPEHDSFILSDASPYDWRNPQNDNLWQGAEGTNNPCPDGWRLPTSAEWSAEESTWAEQNYNGAYASPLKLTAAGYRARASGTV